jgi:hypothetical protein
MVICNSIGYFTLVLSALLPLVLSDLLHIWILQVLSLLCHSYPPASLSEHSLSVSLLVLPTATSFPALMFRAI